MIPHELLVLRQWVAVREDKRPRNPKTLQYADSMDPSTWGTYEEAKATGLYTGFVFSKDDPYCIIDLDDKPSRPATEEQRERHVKIIDHFSDCYIERSISGTGFHIICKGAVAKGLNRDNVEIYSWGRMAIITGNQVSRTSMLEDKSALVTRLWQEMGGQEKLHELEEIEGTESDQVIIDRAMNASNGDKFSALCRGELDGYPSASEADLALFSMLCFYTPDNAQVERIYRMTELGQRKKAQRPDYVQRTLTRVRANEPKIDLAQFKLPEIVEEQEQHESELPSEFSLPPGLVGELATYFYASAQRQVPEYAVGAALALVAGIAGRSYNISGTGLNQYILVLGRTGTGKESIAAGIERVMNECRKTIPMAERFIGPAVFESGQAIVRTLSDRPCFVSIMAEFGLTLQRITDARNPASNRLKQVLLDVYAKSGQGRVLHSSAYSDVEKNTKMVMSPALTILGESTPDTFYEGLDVAHVAEGLVSRFSIIEYEGNRQPRNENADFIPDKTLVENLGRLITAAQGVANNNQVVQIQFDDAAYQMLKRFDSECDNRIHNDEPVTQLWNRAHLKALKISALLATGMNAFAPVVTRECAAWAIAFVEREAALISKRFSNNETGRGDHRQLADAYKIANMLLAKRFPNNSPDHDLLKQGIISYRIFSQYCHGYASFRTDRLGSNNAIKKMLDTLVACGSFTEIPKQILMQKFNYQGKAYGFTKT